MLDSFGSFLEMEKGCIVLRDKKGNTKKYPMFEMEIGEVVLKSGNLVSTGVLSALGFWAIDVLICTRNGYPIAMLKNLEDDSHVKTRICQYESLKNGKAEYLAKQLVIGKIDFIDFTRKIQGVVSKSGIRNGLAHVFAPHATGVIILTEHDPSLDNDVRNLLEKLIPKRASYRHPSNAHSHLRSMLLPLIELYP